MINQADIKREYNLEERTFKFAQEVRILIKMLPINIINNEDSKQLIRASASIGANYIEANENLGRKDFEMHIKISRKEAKESVFFLKLLKASNTEIFQDEFNVLIQEANELKLIFSSIIEKSKLKKE